MKIFSVYDQEFKPYGRVLTGYDTAELLAAMEAIPLPESGTAYKPAIDSLESCMVFRDFQDRAYGGMPIQLGMCWGYNTKLNCLEYHRDSEINLSAQDFVLLLALRSEIEDGKLDTAKVLAFYVPKGVPVEVFATAMHYAPCRIGENPGFRVAVALPKGTNTEKPEIQPDDPEDSLLWARNKWLLAHPDSKEAENGAYPGLTGKNIDISID